jgi:major vault protein
MSDSRDREKREIALAPGSYAYMQDTTKGIVKTFVGPTVINQTGTEVPVVWNADAGRFDRCNTLEDAVRLSPVAVEGSYLVLENPSKDGKHPLEGPSMSPDLEVGRKIVIPGPCTFALWPGQAAAVVKGHQLRSNEYLLVRVYNEEEACRNWTKAVVKPASGDTPASTAAKVPVDLTVGKLIIIRGTEVSFYIPPTGVMVVPDERNGFVRDALTLEKLEYAILVDENGSKRYECGPQVVFPKPTETFRKDEKGNIKFRAIELNEIQGLHIKVISSYSDEGGVHKEGEELFITGKDTSIYFPREEHSLIKYDGKSKHFATAVPTGEGRYVMDRITGEIRMVKGPAMLLPDPRHEVIVRRALSDNQSNLWYPGNNESLEYNRVLRNIQQAAPTTRQGAISEGDFERGAKKGMARSKGGGMVGVAAAMNVNALMDASLVSGDQNHVGDEFSRGSTYTSPRTVTLNTKFEGVPSIDTWTGYAIMVVSKSGKRRVEKGPGTVLLGYDESLEVLELSTGKPKTTDNLLKTVYLRITNNKVSDKVNVETNDHVGIELSMSFRVNFEGDEARWFEADNYVKLLCDHIRSVLKGAIKKAKVEGFYINAVDTIRDLVLGEKGEDGRRPGMFFPENGMRVTDVEVLGVKIQDDRIHKMLNEAQHEAVRSNIELSNARRDLTATQEKEGIARQMAETKSATVVAQHRLDIGTVASQLDLFMAKVAATMKQDEENKRSEASKQEIQDLVFDRNLARAKRQADQLDVAAQVEHDRRLQMFRAEAEAVVQRFAAAQGGFSEAILALSHDETVVKVAEALSVQNFIGGQNFTEVVQKVFAGTPLQHLLDRVVAGGQQKTKG